MYPKYKVEALANKLIPELQLDWELEYLNIYWAVKHYNKRLKLDTGKCCAFSKVNLKKKSALITLYYNKMCGKWHTVETIYHEMLHVKLWKLCEYGKNTKIRHISLTEERLVQKLSIHMMKLYRRSKNVKI